MANSSTDPFSGSVFLSTLCSVFLSNIRRTTCSRVQTSFDGTVGDRMSNIVRVQREIVCFSSVPNRTLPGTESRSVGGLRRQLPQQHHCATRHVLRLGVPQLYTEFRVLYIPMLGGRCRTGKNEFQTERAGSRKNPRQGTCYRLAGWLKRQRLLSTTCCVNTSVIGHTRRRLFGRSHELCHSGHRVLGSGGPHVNLHVQPVTGVSSVNLGSSVGSCESR